ncbi:MAG: VCBS repeat-containing protein [Microcoleus sp. PH2017_01_SCD_O_A]|nr:VCBS repeat-containing protein [Microcoleus sp. PH2017_01_SCD_O_A]
MQTGPIEARVPFNPKALKTYSGVLGLAPKVDFTTGNNPNSVSIGDFNGDGKPDLAVANYSSDTASILLNTTPTGATTPTFATQVDFPTGRRPSSVSIGDINGDGKPDLAVANLGSIGNASILLNTTPTGATTPTFATKVDFPTGPPPRELPPPLSPPKLTSQLAVAPHPSAPSVAVAPHPSASATSTATANQT